MQTITEQLLKELKNTTDLKKFLQNYENSFISKAPCDYLNEIMEAKKVSVSTVAKESGIGEYVYKIFKGERNPSRDVLISISFGMNLSLEETQFLLRISKFAILDSRDKRDGVIIYSLTHGLSVFQADDILEENNLVTIVG